VPRKERLGRPIGFASWSKEENRVRKEKKNRRKTMLFVGKNTQGGRGMIFQPTSNLQPEKRYNEIYYEVETKQKLNLRPRNFSITTRVVS